MRGELKKADSAFHLKLTLATNNWGGMRNGSCPIGRRPSECELGRESPVFLTHLSGMGFPSS
jgi:hypothetical protein